MKPITIIYSTARKDSKIEWFLAALQKQAGEDLAHVQLIVVDFWAEGLSDEWRDGDALAHCAFLHNAIVLLTPGLKDFTITPPMPNVWQGRHRLTSENWFAASSVRSTGICLAKHETLCFADDLSCPTATWWAAVKQAAEREDTITAGAYRKVGKLHCENGEIATFEDAPDGHDNRYGYGSDEGPVKCGGNWLYGCNLVGPTEAFLSINGYPIAWCDGLGFEDVIAGIMLEKKGWKFVYDRRQMTFEDRDLHFVGQVMKRSDYGVSPQDKSHAVLHAAQNGDGWHPNYFGEGGIRALRQRILAGEPFPVCQIPQHEWFTGTPLKDL